MSSRKYQKKAAVLGEGNKWFNLCALLPIAVVLGIVPLIVRLYAYDNGLENYDFYLPTGNVADFFNYYKMVIFLIAAFAMACLTVAKLTVEKKNIKFSKMFIPLFVYGLLALFSSIGSKYQPYPWTGIYEQFEPVWVLLGYVLVAYYAFIFVNKKEDILFLIGVLAVSTVFMLAIGVSQAFFTDFFQSSFGQKLIVPKKYHEAVFSQEGGGLNFTFQKGHVYLTLYNPNYVGSYAALLAPLFLMMIFASERVIVRIAYVVLYIGVLWALLGSQSDAGLAGVIVAFILLVPFFAKFKLKFWLPVILIAGISVGAFRIYGARTGRGGFFEVLKNSTKIPETVYTLTNIETTDHDVAFTYMDNVLHVSFDPDSVTFIIYDDEGSAVDAALNEENYSITINDERFAGIKLTPVMFNEGYMGFEAAVAGNWNFAVVDGDYYYYTPYGKYMKFRNSETWMWLARYGKFANGRGALWCKTVPLLKSYILLGSGADTFSLVYPNYDFLSMKNTGYWQNIVTKPHNMYLQVGVQTGVLSLIAMLVFYLWYFFTCFIESLRTKKHNFFSLVSGGIAAGTAGYMVSQLINDSSITVAPIFWTLIGIGFSACMILKQQNKEAKAAADAEKTAQKAT